MRCAGLSVNTGLLVALAWLPHGTGGRVDNNLRGELASGDW